MIRPHLLFAATVLLAASAAAPASAAGFTCPTRTLDEAGAAAVKAALPAGDALEQPQALNGAVEALRARGISAPLIMDGMISAYCQTVAGQPGLSDAQKTAQVRGFATRAVRAVYALDSADAIILDVTVPPSVATAIGGKAKAAGLTPAEWMRGTLEAAAK
ncbi:hypothetical protein ACLBXM_19150 [Xanthobacteraceae bacterium A53D]